MNTIKSVVILIDTCDLRCTQYNFTWKSWSFSCDRSVLFSRLALLFPPSIQMIATIQL